MSIVDELVRQREESVCKSLEIPNVVWMNPSTYMGLLEYLKEHTSYPALGVVDTLMGLLVKTSMEIPYGEFKFDTTGAIERRARIMEGVRHAMRDSDSDHFGGVL